MQRIEDDDDEKISTYEGLIANAQGADKAPTSPMELAKQLEIYVRTAQKSASIESKDQYKLTRGAFKPLGS